MRRAATAANPSISNHFPLLSAPADSQILDQRQQQRFMQLQEHQTPDWSNTHYVGAAVAAAVAAAATY